LRRGEVDKFGLRAQHAVMRQRPATSRRVARALGEAIVAAALVAGCAAAAASSAAAPSLSVVPNGAPGAPSTASVKLTVVAGGLSSPVDLVSPKDGTHRLFIVEQTGTVRIVKNGRLLPGAFLDLRSAVSTGSEQGLLGLAFHPAFASNRKFYVDYTDLNGNTVIREYRASTTSPNLTESGSGRTILQIRQPYPNHNGGDIVFGPDGYLYIGMGDGGSAGDPGSRAQSLSSLLGKMLRIDVNGTAGTRHYRIPAGNPYAGTTGLDEIWQRGLRNPWRFSFDAATGALWIGDVGQNRYEEVDRALRTSSGAGRGVNWGWRVMEGFHCYNPGFGCSTLGKRLPLLEYSHDANGRCAIVGGFVYRGSAIPSLTGWYLFGDDCSGEVLAVPSTASSQPTPVTLFGTGSGRVVSSFGQDWAGELYVVDLRGTVFRIDPA
jgi:glucose/arabinose dehydrogenase